MADKIALEMDTTALDKALSRLPKNLANKGARKATREAAKIVQRDAVQLAPIDTGQLEASIKVRARKRSRRNRGTVGHSVMTGEHLFQGDQFYAGFQELGTEKMEANPFLRPALWGNQRKIFAKYREVLTGWLKTDAKVKKLQSDTGVSFSDLGEDLA